MILFIFCIYCLIGTAQLIEGAYRAIEMHKDMGLPMSSNKPILVKVARGIISISAFVALILVWPLWKITDERIKEVLEAKRKKLIEDDKI